jgi:hypothetical protein
VQGLETFEGQPHFFDAEWDPTDEAEDVVHVYKLSQVSKAARGLAIERTAIHERWWAKHDAEGRTERGTERWLPEDRDRREVIDTLLDPELRINPDSFIRAIGTFRGIPGAAPLGRTEVRWERYSSG